MAVEWHMKGNVDGEEAKARLKARKRMMDCFSDTRNKRQLEQINFTHFTFANRTCKAPERRHNHKVNFTNSAIALKQTFQYHKNLCFEDEIHKRLTLTLLASLKRMSTPLKNGGVVTFLFTIFCLQLHSLAPIMYFYSPQKGGVVTFFLVGCIAWHP